MLVCQDPLVKLRKMFNVKRMRCPNCKKKMTLFGRGKEAVYRCVCGHSETQAQMNKRMKEN